MQKAQDGRARGPTGARVSSADPRGTHSGIAVAHVSADQDAIRGRNDIPKEQAPLAVSFLSRQMLDWQGHEGPFGCSPRNVMADVPFDTVAVGPEAASLNRNRATGGSSQDDAVLISSDNESDYSDLDDGQSDTPLPSLDELAKATRRVVASAGVYPNPASLIESSELTREQAGRGSDTASGDDDDDDAKKLSVTEEASPDGESASTQTHQQGHSLEHSSAPPSAAAPSGTLALSGPPEVEQEPPVPVDGASCEPGRASTPETATSGTVEKRSLALRPPEAEAQPTPSSACPQHLVRRRTARPGRARRIPSCISSMSRAKGK
ncbi:hypothetical protein F5883DRAFT_530145 [Diaporthe sp. PMI_573]|nr:hypothetical protein F5883DRAFT_530145 [Diaporthaceae sp. PMI_573]